MKSVGLIGPEQTPFYVKSTKLEAPFYYTFFVQLHSRIRISSIRIDKWQVHFFSVYKISCNLNWWFDQWLVLALAGTRKREFLQPRRLKKSCQDKRMSKLLLTCLLNDLVCLSKCWDKKLKKTTSFGILTQKKPSKVPRTRFPRQSIGWIGC